MTRSGLVVVCAFFAGAAVASAEMVRIDFSGTVETIASADGVLASDFLGGQVTVGTPFSGFYQVDTSTTDMSLGLIPDQAVYRFTEPPFQMQVQMGGFQFRSNPSDTELIVTASNDSPPLAGSLTGGDFYTVASARDEIVVGLNGLKDFRPEMVLQLIGDESTRETVDMLSTAEQHEMFANSTFNLQGIDPTNPDNSFLLQSGNVRFALVPEPSCLSLLAIAGFAAMVAFRRR